VVGNESLATLLQSTGGLMKESDTISLSNIRERDIDLILVEEFRCSTRFRDWFLAIALDALGHNDRSNLSSISVQHSLSRGSKAEGQAGETDIHLELSLGERRIVVLVENKIDALFTDRQPERYREESERLVRDGHCDEALTILVCPKRYREKHPEAQLFDVCILHEEIADRFRELTNVSDGEVSERYRFRREMVELGLSREKRGYQSVPDGQVSAFWKAYFELVQSVAPGLGMKQPSQKPSGAHFIRFECLEQSFVDGFPRVSLCHKLRPAHSRIELEFPHWGAEIDSLNANFAPLLDEGMNIRVGPARRAKNAPLMVSVSVPTLDVHSAAEPQCDVIRQCLGVAEQLRDWYHRHLMSLERFTLAK